MLKVRWNSLHREKKINVSVNVANMTAIWLLEQSPFPNGYSINVH